MLDTGAYTVHMAKGLAEEVGLSYSKERGFFMGVNARSLPIEGIAWGALIQSISGKVRLTSPLPLWMTRNYIWALISLIR